VEAPETSGGIDEGNPRVEAALLFDVEQVKPGDTLRVGVRFRMDPGWHIYWRNPGESGLPTEVAWDTPGATVGELQWPFPSTLRTSDGFITTYGYKDEVLLFAPAKVSEAASGRLMFSAAVDALVCETRCLPAPLALMRSLPVGERTLRSDRDAPLFDATQARVPRPAEAAGYTASVVFDGQKLQAGQPFSGTLTLASRDRRPVPGVEGDFFAPERLPGVDRLTLTQETPGRFRMKGVATHDVPAELPRLLGALRLGPEKAAGALLALDVAMTPGSAAAAAPVAAAPEPPRPAAPVAKAPEGKPAPVTGGEETPLSLGLALVFAFLGGALLNLMPCVFPVLALKAYGFTRLVREDRSHVVPHALAYAGGILGSMGVLAAVVLAVRAGGRSVGWGFQFQEPLFVAGVSAILVAFALNLFGVFHVGTDGTALAGKVDASKGLARSAGEGVLAVVLATPCSAPLLGTAVGFAFAAGAATVVAIFLALGLGLALPFCLLVLVPGLARRLPRPGAWMERGKQLLGFALLGTTVWLAWVMGGLAGVDGMARLLTFLVAVGLGAWVYGHAQAVEGGRKLTGVVAALALVGLVGAYALRFEEAAPVSRTATVASAQPWSEAAVAEALKAGQPVFIDFTADWCLTCKFNERTVLAREEVRSAFTRHGVAFFVADWTRRDARIREKLAAHGRAGVPMYLVISPAAPDRPQVLPELLTVETVLSAVEQAAGPVADAT
jgi:thiol:disulfide interchange protein DsbD